MIEEIFRLIVEAAANGETLEKPNSLGHKFINVAMMDGRGGSWTQVYRCECGAATVVSRAGHRKPIAYTKVITPCPLAEAQP